MTMAGIAISPTSVVMAGTKFHPLTNLPRVMFMADPNLTGAASLRDPDSNRYVQGIKNKAHPRKYWSDSSPLVAGSFDQDQDGDQPALGRVKLADGSHEWVVVYGDNGRELESNRPVSEYAWLHDGSAFTLAGIARPSKDNTTHWYMLRTMGTPTLNAVGFALRYEIDQKRVQGFMANGSGSGWACNFGLSDLEPGETFYWVLISDGSRLYQRVNGVAVGDSGIGAPSASDPDHTLALGRAAVPNAGGVSGVVLGCYGALDGYGTGTGLTRQLEQWLAKRKLHIDSLVEPFRADSSVQGWYKGSVQVSGGLVTQWDDSENGNDLTPQDTNNKPTYVSKSAHFNGAPTVHIGQTSGGYNNAASLRGDALASIASGTAKPWSAVLAALWDGDSNGRLLGFGHSSGSGRHGYRIKLDGSTGTTREDDSGTTSGWSGGALKPVPQRHVYTYDGADALSYVDGDIDIASALDVQPATTDRFNLGGLIDSGGYVASAVFEIPEAAFVDRQVGPGDVALIDDYMRREYWSPSWVSGMLARFTGLDSRRSLREPDSERYIQALPNLTNIDPANAAHVGGQWEQTQDPEQPTLTTNKANSVHTEIPFFDGVDDNLKHSGVAGDFNDVHNSTGVVDLFFRICPASITTNHTIWRNLSSYNGSGIILQVKTDGDLELSVGNSSGSAALTLKAGAGSIVAGTEASGLVRKNGADVELWIGGSMVASGTISSPDDGDASIVPYIGATANAGNGFHGWIDEIILYNRNVTDAERDDIFDYLDAIKMTLSDLTDTDNSTRTLVNRLAGDAAVDDGSGKASSVTDERGNYDATQSDPAKRPAINANWNGSGHQSLGYDGSTWMEVASALATGVLAGNGQHFTLVSVVAPASQNNDYNIGIGAGVETADDDRVTVHIDATSGEIDAVTYDGSSLNIQAGQEVTAAEPTIVVASHDGNSWRIMSYNPTDGWQFSEGGTNVGSVDVTRAFLGAWMLGGSMRDILNGELAEADVLDGSVSNGDMAAMILNLKDKYAIA